MNKREQCRRPKAAKPRARAFLQKHRRHFAASLAHRVAARKSMAGSGDERRKEETSADIVAVAD